MGAIKIYVEINEQKTKMIGNIKPKSTLTIIQLVRLRKKREDRHSPKRGMKQGTLVLTMKKSKGL